MHRLCGLGDKWGRRTAGLGGGDVCNAPPPTESTLMKMRTRCLTITAQ
jgi:hypothetical protein